MKWGSKGFEDLVKINLIFEGGENILGFPWAKMYAGDFCDLERPKSSEKSVPCARIVIKRT